MTYLMHIYFKLKLPPRNLKKSQKPLEEGKALDDLLANKRNILALKETPFTLMNGYLYKLGTDDIMRRCALEHE
jgi:hypothetical protein